MLPQVRRLDLHEVGGARCGEELDVGERIAPLVRDQADIHALFLQQLAQAPEFLDLLFLGLRDHGRFDQQLVRP
jgi:hypothetical protein